MATPEHKLADEIIEGLESDGLLDSGKRAYARDIVRQHLEQEKRRGLKDHEIARLVNAIRDELSPICTSQQLRGRIAAALTWTLLEMGLCLDHAEAVRPQADRTGIPTLGDGIIDNKKWCAWCNDSHVVGGCPRVPGG